MLLSVCFWLQRSSQGNLLASYAGSMCAGDINIIFCSLLICEYCMVAVCWMERLDRAVFRVLCSMNTNEGIHNRKAFMIRKSMIGSCCFVIRIDIRFFGD